MTSKELANCSGDHHKAYYTYIHILGGIFGRQQIASFLLSEGPHRVQECVCAFVFLKLPEKTAMLVSEERGSLTPMTPVGNTKWRVPVDEIRT